MKSYRYAILPLFALGLAIGGPAVAGEGDSPSVSNQGADASGYERDRDVGVEERNEERAQLPFEKDPDGNDPGTGDVADPDSGNAAAAGTAGNGDGTSASGGNAGAGTGGNGGTGGGG